jgi:hypothetical protein
MNVAAEPAFSTAAEEMKWQRQCGTRVSIKVTNGKEILTCAYLSSDQNRAASSSIGMPIIFRKIENDRAVFIESLESLDKPWLWLGLSIAISFVALFASKLMRDESYQ